MLRHTYTACLVINEKYIYCAVRAESLNVVCDNHRLYKVVSYLRLLLCDLSPRGPGLDPRSMWRFVVDKAVLGPLLFSQYFGLSLSVSYHHCSVLIFI